MPLFPSRGFRRTRERASGLLLAVGVDDLAALTTTGQTMTVTRASTRTVIDSAGRVQTLGYGQFPWSMVYNTEDAVWEPTIDSHRGSTNLVLQSENFGATWGATGTPSRTSAALRCGDLQLDLIGDDDAGAFEGYTQTVTFTANAQKAVMVHVAKGTATSSVIRLRDTTALANRLLAAITWSGSTPTVTMTTGTHLKTVALANGVHRLLFQTTSVTATNTNVLGIFPATDAALAVANTGTLYVGGVQAENNLWPTSYVRTTTGTVTKSADKITVPLNWLPQDFTVYARFQRPNHAGATGGGIGGICGTSSVTPGFYVLLLPGGTPEISAALHDGTTQVGATATLPTTAVIDACVQYNSVATGGKVRVDVGSGFGAYSSSTGAISAWSDDELVIGAGELTTGVTPNYHMDGGLRKLLIAPGARTLAEMRGLNV